MNMVDYRYTYIYTINIMAIVLRNGIGDLVSNPAQAYLHFVSYSWEKHAYISSPFN